MKLLLDVRRWDNPCVGGPIAMWRDSEPFVENRRGLLIHRPRYVSMFESRRGAHVAIEFYCGGSTTDTRERGNVMFLPAPPEGSLLCAACEARAVMAGLPSASALAGRHICIGRLKAINVCHIHGEAHS